MNIYLSLNTRAGLNFIEKIEPISNLNILCSFEYRSGMGKYKPCDCKRFIADSGAFTAMNAGKHIGMDYVDKYIQWINENDIQYFMEMDLDEIIGYEQTLQITKHIEQQTQKKCISSWHLQRGADGWKRMCDEYPYVAISLSRMTNTSKWLVQHKFEPLRFFLHEANMRKTKVHALGCNSLDLLRKYHFHSADSSTHTQGARYGRVLWFHNGKLKDINDTRDKKIDGWASDANNVKTMIEVMRYAENHL